MIERRRLLFRSDLTLDMPIFPSGLLLNSCSVLHPYSQETTESEASDLQQTGIIFPFQVDIATPRDVEKFGWSFGRFVVRGPAKRKFKSLFFPLPSYVIFILTITFCPQARRSGERGLFRRRLLLVHGGGFSAGAGGGLGEARLYAQHGNNRSHI
jgi:hypothetical protein